MIDTEGPRKSYYLDSYFFLIFSGLVLYATKVSSDGQYGLGLGLLFISLYPLYLSKKDLSALTSLGFYPEVNGPGLIFGFPNAFHKSFGQFQVVVSSSKRPSATHKSLVLDYQGIIVMFSFETPELFPAAIVEQVFPNLQYKENLAYTVIDGEYSAKNLEEIFKRINSVLFQ